MIQHQPNAVRKSKRRTTEEDHELPSQFRIQHIHKPHHPSRVKKHVFIDQSPNSNGRSPLQNLPAPPPPPHAEKKNRSDSSRRKMSLGCVDYFKDIQYEPLSDQRFCQLTMMMLNLFPSNTTSTETKSPLAPNHNLETLHHEDFPSSSCSRPSSPSTTTTTTTTIVSVRSDESVYTTTSTTTSSLSSSRASPPSLISNNMSPGTVTISVDGRSLERHSHEKHLFEYSSSFTPKQRRIVRTSISIHELLN